MRRNMIATHDHLSLLASIDPGLAHHDPADSDQATALFHRIVATPRPSPSSRPGYMGRNRRIALLAGVLVALGLLVPTLAVGTSLFRLLDDQPAPQAVSDELRSPARGLVQLSTSTGETATLYRAESKRGDCIYLRLTETAEPEAPRHFSRAQCVPRADESRPIGRFTQTWRRSDGESLEFVMGRASSSVASLAIVFSDRSSMVVPLSHGHFLYELKASPAAVSVEAYDDSGAVIDRRSIEDIRPPSRR
jgi:hypothetical protein